MKDQSFERRFVCLVVWSFHLLLDTRPFLYMRSVYDIAGMTELGRRQIARHLAGMEYGRQALLVHSFTIELKSYPYSPA